jgi:hypothetical protein
MEALRRLEEFFPILKKRPGILFGEKVTVTPGLPLTEAQRRLAEKFGLGIAEALGVPPEAIRQEIVEKWIREWSKAFVKPEFWQQVSEEDMRNFGRITGEMIKALLGYKESSSSREEVKPQETKTEGLVSLRS